METKTCSQCGVSRPWLHRHHILPRSVGGSDEPSNIALICANCHEDVHGGPCGGGLRGGLAQTPEAVAKKSASLKAKWQDPVWRENQLAKRRAAWSGERGERRRAKVSEAQKKWYADNPEAVAERNRKISEAKSGRTWSEAERAARERRPSADT